MKKIYIVPMLFLIFLSSLLLVGCTDPFQRAQNEDLADRIASKITEPLVLFEVKSNSANLKTFEVNKKTYYYKYDVQVLYQDEDGIQVLTLKATKLVQYSTYFEITYWNEADTTKYVLTYSNSAASYNFNKEAK